MGIKRTPSRRISLPALTLFGADHGAAVAAFFAGVVLLISLIAASSQPPSTTKSLGAYATSLANRTPNQQFNARRAARLVDGALVAPGQTFSFNNRVGGWAGGNGYRKAPVSYNGILVDEYGGGVCQTSTTVYNAALLAGLTIVERHSHTFAPGYVPAGRDAAVAYQNVDLRVKNPFAFSVKLHVGIKDQFLICEFTAPKLPTEHVSIVSRTLDTFPAPTAPPEPGAGHRRSRWRLKGRDGVRVATFRQFYDSSGNLVKQQLVSDNTYRAITAAVGSSGSQ